MTEYRHRTVFAAACVGMLLFGIVLTALGSVLPAAMPRLGLGGAAAGSLFSIMSLGILAGSVLFGPIVDRRGYKGMLMLAVALIFLGLEGMAFAGSWGVLAAAMLLIGFGGGIINGGTNALVADISAGGRSAGLALLGVFFGIGAFGVPFLLGALQGVVGYVEVLAGIGAAVALVLVFYARVTFPAPKQPRGFPLRRAAGLLRDPVLLAFGAILFFQSGMEITVGGWAATYFDQGLGLPPEQALFLLSFYWLGMTLARLGLGRILTTISPATILGVSLAVAMAGAVTLMGAGTAVAGGTGVVLLGVGFAAVFPIVLGYVGDRYSTLSGTAFSLVLVMALLGGSTLPAVAGVLGESIGLRPSFIVVPVGLTAIAILFLMVRPMMGRVQAAAITGADNS